MDVSSTAGLAAGALSLQDRQQMALLAMRQTVQAEQEVTQMVGAAPVAASPPGVGTLVDVIA